MRMGGPEERRKRQGRKMWRRRREKAEEVVKRRRGVFFWRRNSIQGSTFSLLHCSLTACQGPVPGSEERRRELTGTEEAEQKESMSWQMLCTREQTQASRESLESWMFPSQGVAFTQIAAPVPLHLTMRTGHKDRRRKCLVIDFQLPGPVQLKCEPGTLSMIKAPARVKVVLSLKLWIKQQGTWRCCWHLGKGGELRVAPLWRPSSQGGCF